MTERPDFLDHEHLYRRIVESSPAAVALLTNEAAARILYASPRVEEISGFSPAELVGGDQVWDSRLHPDEIGDLNARWAQAVHEETVFEAEYRFRHRNGEWRWLRETNTPVREPDGTVRYRQSFTDDITAERFAQSQAERSEARYRALVERLPVIVYVDSDDPEPQSLYVSPNSAQILGYEPGAYLADPRLWFASMHPDDLPRIQRAWAEAVATQRPFHAEYRDLKPDGTVVWIRDHSILVRDDEGRALFWQGVLHDITAEREAEAALDHSEARYRSLIEQMPVVVYLDAFGPFPDVRYVSTNVEQLLGHPASTFVEDPGLWARLLHPDDRERAIASWRTGWDLDGEWSDEYRFVHPAGHEVWVRDVARTVVDPRTGERMWQGVMVDLTAEREAELERQRSERRHRALVEQVPAIMYEMGPDDERRTLFVSPHAEQLLGYPRQEWLDQPDIWQELLHPDDRETELAALDHHNETGAPWQREYRLIASDGREVWVSDHAQFVTDAEGARWLGVMLDVTPQKEAEELLRLAKDDLEMRVLTRTAELEEANEMMSLEIGERRRIEAELRAAQDRYRTIVDGLPAAVYAWETNWEDDPDPPPWEHYTSPQVEEILGFPVNQWHEPGFWKERVHPHDRDRIVALADHCSRTGEPFSAEYRYLAADGRVVWVLDRATLRRRNQRGEPRLFQGVMLDITARKEAEEKAAVAEERFRVLVEDGPVGNYVYELVSVEPLDVRMRYVSPRIGEVVGYPTSHWQGDPGVWVEMTHPDDRARLIDAFAHWSNGEPWSIEYRVIAGDGHIVWVLDRGRAVERADDGSPRLFQGVIVDITELRERTQAIEASEARFRSVIETIPAVPWTEQVDPATGASRYDFIGPQVTSVFGWTSEELMMEPDHFFRLVHPDDQARIRAASDRCDATGEPWDELYRVIHRDGSVHWIFSYADRAIEDGRPVWHGISLDVTRHVASGVFPVPVGGGAETPPG